MLNVWNGVCKRVAKCLIFRYQLHTRRLVSVAWHRAVHIRLLELLDRFDKREKIRKVICHRVDKREGKEMRGMNTAASGGTRKMQPELARDEKETSIACAQVAYLPYC